MQQLLSTIRGIGSVHSSQSSTVNAAVIINHKGHKLAPHWIVAKSVSGTPLVGGDVKKIHPLTDSSGDTNSMSCYREREASDGS